MLARGPERASKAEHFHAYVVPVDGVDVVVKLYAAQDSDGMWYGSDSVEFGGTLDTEMGRRNSALVPATAEKWSSEAEALKQRCLQVAMWCGLNQPGWLADEWTALDKVRKACEVWKRNVETHIAARFAAEAAAEKNASQGNGRVAKAASSSPAKTKAVTSPRTSKRAIVEIPIDKISRHPANRTIAKASVKGLAEDLQRRGLLSPIQVRAPGEHWGLPEGHYQIVFGERRYWAAQVAGWDTIAAEIVELSDAEAQAAITAENGQREQLNDVQRIERLQWDMKPVAEGGGGLTQTEAAAAMGIDQSTASTLLRVAKLPKVWLEKIIAGEMTASHLRPVARYADCPRLLKLLEADRTECAKSRWPEDQERWETRLGIEHRIEDVLIDATRPLTKADMLQREYNVPRLGELGDEHLAELDVHEISADDGKTVRRIFNLDAYHKLSQGADQHAGGRNGSSKSNAAKGGSKKPVPTPAEVRKQEAEQDKALVERIQRPGGLAELALRWAMVQQLKPGSEWTQLTARMLFRGARETDSSSQLDLDEWDYLAQRLLRLDRCTKPEKIGLLTGYKNRDAYGRYTLETYRGSDDHVGDGQTVECYTAALILWPQSDRIEAAGRLATRGFLPEHWPVVPAELLAECAAGLGARVADTWDAAAGTRQGQARLWLERFVNAYTKRQLVALAKQLGVRVYETDKLDTMRGAVLESHWGPQTLKLPDVLRDLPKLKAKKAKKGA